MINRFEPRTPIVITHDRHTCPHCSREWEAFTSEETRTITCPGCFRNIRLRWAGCTCDVYAPVWVVGADCPLHAPKECYCGLPLGNDIDPTGCSSGLFRIKFCHCGAILTPEERHYYGHTCNRCEAAQSEELTANG